MKKSFYFALAATVGLFASCSSDDLSADAPQQPGIELNDGQAAQISINVDSPNATTRGTGSVKGTTWGGQTFNLFMFDKGTFTPSMYVPSVGKAAVDIYKDAEMTTEAGSKIANQIIDDVIQYQYFPPTGRFDFWAYRIDDAWVDATGKAGWEDGADATKKVIEGVAAWTAGATTYTWDTETAASDEEKAAAVDKTQVEGGWAPGANVEGLKDTWYKYLDGDDEKYAKCTAVNVGEGGYTASTATQVTVPFKINGSQDLMIADTKTGEAATKLALSDQYNDTEENAPSYIYSAYAARRGVNPEMTFKHQLVRLQFQVKAATRDVSTAATPKLAVGTPNAAGDKYYAGFKVNKVEVWSKDKGKLIIAYKGATAPEARIEWPTGDDPDAQPWTARDENDEWITTTKLTPFELKSRVKTLDEPAQVYMVSRNPAAATVTFAAKYKFDGTTEEETKDAGEVDIKDDMIVYPSEELDDETGLPSSDPITIKQAKTNGVNPVYFVAVKKGTHSDGKTGWDKPTYVDDPSEKLVPLESVVPGWTGYEPAKEGTPAYKLLEEAVVSYEWGNELSVLPNGKSSSGSIATPPTDRTVGVAGNYYTYDDGGVNKYYLCTKVNKNTDGSSPSTVDPTTLTNIPKTDLGKVLSYDSKYYICYEKDGVAVKPGDAEATPIGESLLVAPADVNGYLVRFHYTRCKMINADNFVDMPGEAIINVKTKANASFSPSKFYTVTAILYSDGEMKFEGGDIEDQTEGTGDLDDGGKGYGAEK